MTGYLMFTKITFLLLQQNNNMDQQLGFNIVQFTGILLLIASGKASFKAA